MSELDQESPINDLPDTRTILATDKTQLADTIVIDTLRSLGTDRKLDDSTFKEIDRIQNQLRDLNTVIYEKSKAALMICGLLKRVALMHLSRHQKPALKTCSSTQTEYISNEKGSELTVDFATLAKPASRYSDGIFSSRDRLALDTLGSLAEEGCNKELLNEAEQIVMKRRRTLHAIKIHSSDPTRQLLTSISGIMDKISSLESEINKISHSDSKTEESSYRRALEVNIEQMKLIGEIISYSETDDKENCNTFAPTVNKVKLLLEQAVSNSQKTLSGCRNTVFETAISNREMRRVSAPSGRVALLDEIRKTSGKLLKTPSFKQKPVNEKSDAITKIHEIQDTLKKAIERHRKALSMTDETDNDELDYWVS